MDQLVSMVKSHFFAKVPLQAQDLIHEFLSNSEQQGGLANDQLLNAMHLATSGAYLHDGNWDVLRGTLWRRLNAAGTD
jgi:hypothetical protein